MVAERSMVRNLPPLSEFGRYELLGRLAVGGMAEIFLAREARSAAGISRRHVVIKRILPHVASDRRFVEMFFDEARIATKLSHPGICHVYEFGEVAGSSFLALEWIDGVSLGKLIRSARESGGIPAPLVVSVCAAIADALHYAHTLHDEDGSDLKIIHRDVSPQNIMVSYEGHAKLLDFGIAKATTQQTKTQSGQVKGKFAYMSPQQCAGEPIDRRADIWSLGVCLYEALTGRPLYHRKTQYETMRCVLEDPVPTLTHFLPNLSGLDEIVQRCLSKNPEQRFDTAAELCHALNAWLTENHHTVTPTDLSTYLGTVFQPSSRQAPIVDSTPFGQSFNTLSPPRKSSIPSLMAPRKEPHFSSSKSLPPPPPRKSEHTQDLEPVDVSFEQLLDSQDDMPTKVTYPPTAPEPATSTVATSMDVMVEPATSLIPTSMDVMGSERPAPYSKPVTPKQTKKKRSPVWLLVGLLALCLIAGTLWLGYTFWSAGTEATASKNARPTDELILSEVVPTTSHSDSNETSAANAKNIEDNNPVADQKVAAQGVTSSDDGTRKAPGGLKVTSIPEGASVLMDGRRIGKTPITIDEVTAGNHAIILSASGYQSYRQSVVVESNATTKLSAELDKRSRRKTKQDEDIGTASMTSTSAMKAQPVKKVAETAKSRGTGSLSINTRPWSKVYASGKLLGTTPLGSVVLPSGSVTLRLVDRDGNEHQKRVKIKVGETNRAFFDLTPKPAN